MRTYYRACFLFGIATSLLLCACRPTTSADDLIGTYSLKFGNGIEILTLQTLGKCHQEIKLNSGVTYVANGEWNYSAESGYITLRGTRSAVDGFWHTNPNIAKIPEGVSAYLPVVRRLFGGFKIGLGEDVFYEKVK